MKDLLWSSKQFSQLNNNQLYELIKLRIEVFVVEQKCFYSELDEKDRHPETRHLTAYMDSKLVAYARLLPPGLSYPDASLGRIAVESSARKQSIGLELMAKCLEEIKTIWPNDNIRIGAQEYLKDFYEKYDFYQSSESYLEAGIRHIQMLRKTK